MSFRLRPNTPEYRQAMVRLMKSDEALTAAQQAWFNHLEVCTDCDEDRECIACAVGGEHSPKAHTDNCPRNSESIGVPLLKVYQESMERVKDEAEKEASVA